MKKFSSLIIGEGLLTLQCAQTLLDEGQRVLGIITANPTIREWAEQRSLPCSDASQDLTEFVGHRPFDYLFSIVNFSIIPNEVLELPQKGAINFHDSLLPKYAGSYATTWAILNRETTHGVTWHQMTSKIDAGDILKQQAVELQPYDTTHTLNLKCYEAGLTSFRELIRDLALDQITPVAQNLNERTYFRHYQRPLAGCLLSWHHQARELDAFVRGLDFGSYLNPMGLPKIAMGGDFFIVRELRVLDRVADKPAGTITHITADSIEIAALDCDVAITRLSAIDGEQVQVSDVVERLGLSAGYQLEEIAPDTANRITEIVAAVCRSEPHWAHKLTQLQPFTLPFTQLTVSDEEVTSSEEILLPIPEELCIFERGGHSEWSRGELLLASFGAFLARVGDTGSFDLGMKVCEELVGQESIADLFASQVPLQIRVSVTQSIAQALEVIEEEIKLTRRHQTYLRDITARYPALSAAQSFQTGFPIVVELGMESADIQQTGSNLRLVFAENGTACRWIYNPQALDRNTVNGLTRQFLVFLKNATASPDSKIIDLPLLTETENHQLLVEWNDTSRDFPQDKCLHHLFEEQVARTPEEIALVFEDKQLTFRELNNRANALAHLLIGMGVRPESLVGICVERSLEMMVGLLAILKAGGAYVPLDPAYPKERLAFMLEDSGVSLLLTQRRLTHRIPVGSVRPVFVDDQADASADDEWENPESAVRPDNLAYVNYTSGSTGKPKGVMVTHQNVVNFCTGMDERIGKEPPGVWLAVTSISFDISVLELFWTLARGFKVVIDSGKERAASQRPDTRAEAARRTMDFSLAYFASDQAEAGEGKYRLLLEGAKFADQNGFSAVWTPERHFHAFGGLYPNPSVISAAIAAVTNQVQIRAGSVVLPLHNPVRVAEEWSVVDNLSNGRVAISFASGWHPTDFIFAPENYANRKQLLFQDLDTVRRLWRGETVTCKDGTGGDSEVKIFPKPIQRDLPVWITSASHPDTFRAAGEMGANLLTHLLGQSIEELAEKIRIYRDAWRRNRQVDGEGHVTVMLHTFVCEDTETARAKVRVPLRNYLGSSVDLIKEAQWTFPTFRNLELKELSEADRDAILEHAFNRYFENSGLFGSPDHCVERVETLEQIGVDEIACLIDFGVDFDSVMSSLRHLKTLKEMCNQSAITDGEPYSLPALLATHGVTHLQCTPSLASMLLWDTTARQALGSLRKLMLGGEALPSSLAVQLGELMSGEIHNMYGPTETTIWSTTAPVNRGSRVHIGRPIANTEIYILDRHSQPVPVGASGELLIGGAGVARGYLNRADLTQEKFVPNPFTARLGERLYRTGDLVRYLPEGNIEFLGRLDQQVKIRGHRVELGEIEAALSNHPAIREAVLAVKETAAGEKRLVAYIRVPSPAEVSITELRDFLIGKLPEPMIPSSFVFIESFPMTPNGKLDRRLLPDPEAGIEIHERPFVPPRTALEEVLASIFCEALGSDSVGVGDNFFELGGHSLLGAQVISRIRDIFQTDLSLRELFEAPTVQDLATAIVNREAKPGQAERIALILKEIQEEPFSGNQDLFRQARPP